MTESLKKSVLMIAYHFPPIQGSSGVQRTLRFARYLPEFGWRPIILSAHPRAYASTTNDQLDDISPEAVVIRAPAWDTSRHLSIGGRYPGFLARPDRWLSWWLGAVPSGLNAIRKHRPSAIWSTYPIATAHMIGATLQSRSGLPWVADFRDPMAQDGYPTDPATWESFSRIEQRVARQMNFGTLTTPSALALYQQRFPSAAERFKLIENGYDEETFAGAQGGEALNPGLVTLVHSGIVYPSERDPSALIAALAQLRDTHPEAYARLRVRFRAPVHDTLLDELARDAGVREAIELCPPIPYREALAEMLRAEGLLILQAANCNAQIPAKLYEYFRAGRPIIALTDPAGDTAASCRNAGVTAIAPLDSAASIAGLLQSFLTDPESGTRPTSQAVEQASRRGRTQQLAALLDQAAQGRTT